MKKKREVMFVMVTPKIKLKSRHKLTKNLYCRHTVDKTTNFFRGTSNLVDVSRNKI